MNENMDLIVITGISGAGKSTALNAVEDIGYYSMDNIPPQLLSKFVELFIETGKRASKVAVVLDIRTREFFNDIVPELERIEALGVNYKLIFLDADDDTIIKRYKEFRRPHPLAPSGNIVEGLEEEREILEVLKKNSDYIIDTSRLTGHKLKGEILKILQQDDEIKFQISFVSFGFKNGILLDGDFIFDVRFLSNPYYVEDLRPLTGKDEVVRDYVFESEVALKFIDKIQEMVEIVVPEYIKDGKLQLTIGIGCTGGKHRSVAISEELKKRLDSKEINVIVDHRDIDR